MLLGILLTIFLGIIFGTITGLIPGIHINLIGALLVSSTAFLTKINPIYTVTFIVAIAITHTFVDFIPSIFLGCPDTDTELSVLPGHELLKQGRGYEAIMLTAYGGLCATIITFILGYPSINFFKFFHNLIQDYIGDILIFTSLLLIFSEKEKFRALFVFILTGILGLIVFKTNLNQPLFPLLTGLFGSSLLITSIRAKTKISKQKTPEKFKLSLVRPMIGSTLASPLCSFLPGLGSGQASIIGSAISKNKKEDFLILVGATNTFVMAFSFISLYAISRTRSGAAATINEIFGSLNSEIFTLILITILISGIIAFFITKKLAKKFSESIEEINYQKLSISTLIFLFLLVLIISGMTGILVLVASTLVGIYAMEFNIRKTNMMGAIIIPVILFYIL